MSRTRLPNRRPSVTREIDFGNRRIAVTASGRWKQWLPYKED